uniref:Uncharacterized protein n=1 Tax=Oryza nivara TaxID=4536 RepID=A0A0E0H2Z1_ORYNI
MMREEQPQCEVQQMSTWHSFYFHCPFSTKHAALSNLKCYHADSGFFAIDFSGEVPADISNLVKQEEEDEEQWLSSSSRSSSTPWCLSGLLGGRLRYDQTGKSQNGNEISR